jgi:hypothetical protein
MIEMLEVGFSLKDLQNVLCLCLYRRGENYQTRSWWCKETVRNVDGSTVTSWQVPRMGKVLVQGLIASVCVPHTIKCFISMPLNILCQSEVTHGPSILAKTVQRTGKEEE